MDEYIDISVNAEEATMLLDSLDWSIQATERSIRQNGSTERLRTKWETLEACVAAVQAAKREWYANTDSDVQA